MGAPARKSQRGAFKCAKNKMIMAETHSKAKRANKFQLADCPTHDATGPWTTLRAAGKCPTKQLQNLRVEDKLDARG